MFKNLQLAYKIAKSLGNIKLVIQSTYTVLVKLLAVLDFVAAQTKDSENTKLGKAISAYVPVIKTAVEKVKAVIEKYSPFLEPLVEAQSEGSVQAELIKALEELETHLK